jgi:glutathione S-transferase
MPRSRSLRVSWTLEELSEPWSYQPVRQEQLHQAEFLAINPAGKVPVLRDQELIMSESVAICCYLAERYGEGSLLPKAGTHTSALSHRWLSFITTELEQPLWTLSKHTFILPQAQRVEEMLPLATDEFESACEVACHWLSDSPYLLGEQFTIADIILTHTLNWAMNARQKLPEPLNNYRKRLSRRPALARALEKELMES